VITLFVRIFCSQLQDTSQSQVAFAQR
jgi:hypothetical protein